MIYLIHPESCSAWTVDSHRDADAAIAADSAVEEVNEEQYMKACTSWGIDPWES